MLLVSDEPSDLASLTRILVNSKWRLRVRRTREEALTVLGHARLPVVICDDQTTGGGWQALLSDLKEMPAPPALIVSSRLADERLWSEVLNLGGYDVLPTPFDQTEVLRVCYQAWKSWERQFYRMPLSAAG